MFWIMEAWSMASGNKIQEGSLAPRVDKVVHYSFKHNWIIAHAKVGISTPYLDLICSVSDREITDKLVYAIEMTIELVLMLLVFFVESLIVEVDV